jgi:hypothetical protein
MVSMCKTLDLAVGSKRTYAGHHKIFLSFCAAFDIEPLAITEVELCRCCAHFVLGHSVRSLPSYMSAVANLFESSGADNELPRGRAYMQFCKGVMRLFGPADEVVRTRALGLEELLLILGKVNVMDREQVCFAAQITVAFFLALRTEDHTDGRLQWGDVYPQPDGSVEFLLPPGKSVRRFRRVAIAHREGLLSAITWLRLLAALTPESARGPDQPIFSTFKAATWTAPARFEPLSRSTFIYRFKESVRAVLKVDPVLYAGYSL